MNKVYCIYKKGDKSIYAYSEIKEYIDRFLLERNSKKFKTKTIKFDSETEYRTFIFTNKDYKLNEYPYQNSADKGDYVSLIATSKEDFTIQCIIEDIEEKSQKFILFIQDRNIKKKYKKSILEFLFLVNKYHELEIDIFSLFVDIFKDTFV